jgi:dienelactone hydrolase
MRIVHRSLAEFVMPTDAFRMTPVRLPVEGAVLDADLGLPDRPRGIVVFAHGSGSSRHSPRNQFVAKRLNAEGFGTLLADLLTSAEDSVDQRTGRLRFDIDLLGRRVVAIVDWLRAHPALSSLSIGLFGASTGAAAALVAAADRPDDIAAVVSRGGRPDLAGTALARVTAPTLLLVGGLDGTVIDMNRAAERQLHGVTALEIIEGASHLFEEPGRLDVVAARAIAWFNSHLSRDAGKRHRKHDDETG